MIYVGIDDTDTLDSRGTNQLAREIARRAADQWQCQYIVRHQLLFDSRIPYTSHNGSASICFKPLGGATTPELIELCRRTMHEWFIPESDPGLCVAEKIDEDVVTYGRRCQQEIVTQEVARKLAVDAKLHLEGLGGTEGGVIGALAAVGLAATGDDGRIVRWKSWPDDLSGPTHVTNLLERDVLVREIESHTIITDGSIDVGKHLRPNLREFQAIVFARRRETEAELADYTAIKLS